MIYRHGIKFNEKTENTRYVDAVNLFAPQGGEESVNAVNVKVVEALQVTASNSCFRSEKEKVGEFRLRNIGVLKEF